MNTVRENSGLWRMSSLAKVNHVLYGPAQHKLLIFASNNMSLDRHVNEERKQQPLSVPYSI